MAMPDRTGELKLYRRFEARLRVLFTLFGDLCLRCFNTSLALVRSGQRPSPDVYCCCMMDNQVRDYWPRLEAVQLNQVGPSWQSQLPERLDTGKRRLPNNGPCSALTCSGCALRNLRPPTCNTQLCTSMLEILAGLGLSQVETNKPEQIEVVLQVESPLDALYGITTGLPTSGTIDQYEQAVNTLIAKLREIPEVKRLSAIDEAAQQRINLMQRGARRK